MEHIDGNNPPPYAGGTPPGYDWVAGSVHGGTAANEANGSQQYHAAGFSAADWHTYGMIWSKGKIEYYIDDPANIYATFTPANFPGTWPFDQGPQFIILESRRRRRLARQTRCHNGLSRRHDGRLRPHLRQLTRRAANCSAGLQTGCRAGVHTRAHACTISTPLRSTIGAVSALCFSCLSFPGRGICFSPLHDSAPTDLRDTIPSRRPNPCSACL